MYSMASLQAHLHLAVRAESAKLSGVAVAKDAGSTGYDRYRAASFAKKIRLGSGRTSKLDTATGAASAKYEAGRMAGTVNVDRSARSYVIDEISGVRALIGK
jgi:hypothetical protein